MSQRARFPGDDPAVEATVRTNWLKGMYVANVLFAVFGLAVLAVPDSMRAVLGVPAGDPVHFGIAAGAVPFAFGLAEVLGLQVAYKTAFLLGVVGPLALAGELPTFAIPLAGLFIIFVVGDLVAIPFPYLLPRQPDGD